MGNPKEDRNRKLGERTVAALKKRHFDAYYAEDREAARRILSELVPTEHSVSWGGSMSLQEVGAFDLLREKGCRLLDRTEVPFQEWIVCDTYLMSSNAVTETGELYNIDGRANRLVALLYGPKQVVMVVGMNKVVKDMQAAYVRARSYAAPVNAQRFDIATPCKKTGSCGDCLLETSVCAQLLETRICRPVGRIKVILVGEDLGF